MQFFSNDLGISLGTSNIMIYVDGKVYWDMRRVMDILQMYQIKNHETRLSMQAGRRFSDPALQYF